MAILAFLIIGLLAPFLLIYGLLALFMAQPLLRVYPHIYAAWVRIPAPVRRKTVRTTVLIASLLAWYELLKVQ